MSDGESRPTGYYIYCIVRSEQDLTFPVASIDGDGAEVGTIRFMDLAAVVSPTSNTRYSVARQQTMAHQLVLENVMQRFTLLPVRYGTVAASREDVIEKLLKRKFGEFHGLLHYLDGKVELGLRVMWQRERLFERIVQENPVIRQVRDSLAGKTEAESHYERIQLGQMVEAAIDAKRDDDAAALLASLRPLAADLKVNKPIMDVMVLNAAFLVPADKQDLFDACVRTMDEEHSGQMLFKYVGPVPPYNFVNVAVRWD